MIKIFKADQLIEKLQYSNYNDYEIYPKTILECISCHFSLSFALRDLEKHRFGKDSNLLSKDRIKMDRLILSLIPKYKLIQNRQLWALNKKDIFLVLIQRLYLRLLGIWVKFPPLSTIRENIPDSFLDYYCPDCKRPVRIYYFSYLGGFHCETGYIIKYIMI